VVEGGLTRREVEMRLHVVVNNPERVRCRALISLALPTERSFDIQKGG
jgi:hypothetical protein